MTLSHTLAVYYAVPTDVPLNPAVLARVKQSTADIQAWYQCATAGVTWELAFPETVRVYYGQQTRLYYKNNGDWWGSLLGEMGANGVPIWTPGTVCAIWAHGAGWWAGAAQFCGVDCGTALLGVEIFPEFNNPAYSGGSCPGGSGVVAWPCTPEGAYAHELGHTLGLPHPADVPATAAVAPHSIMQTNWNYPDYAPGAERPWGFLTLERQTILSDPFMKWSVVLRQTHPGCETVNLPSTGAAPVAGFVRDGVQPPNVFSATNTSTGATWSYWTFGDYGASNTTDAYHVYAAPGTYPVTLRVMASNAMISTASVSAPVVDVSPAAAECRFALAQNAPNPARDRTVIGFRLSDPGVVELAIFDLTGRRVQTLASGYRPPGTYSASWDGRNAGGGVAPAGVYMYRLRAGERVVALRLVVAR